MHVRGKMQKKWRDDLAEVLIVRDKHVGVIPMDKHSRDGRGDSFPTDQLDVLLSKRIDMEECIERLREYLLKIEQERDIFFYAWVVKYGEHAQVSVKYMRHIQFLLNLVEFVEIERMRLSSNVAFVYNMRGVEFEALYYGDFLKSVGAYMEASRELRNAVVHWQQHKPQIHNEHLLWRPMRGGRGLDGVEPRNQREMCLVYEDGYMRWYNNGCRNGWSHPKLYFDDPTLSCVKRIVDAAGIEHGLWAANLFCALRGVLMQSRSQRGGKRVDRVSFVTGMEGKRLMVPRGLNYRIDAFGNDHVLAGHSKYGHPETLNVWYCDDERCRFYWTHIHGCNVSCPGWYREWSCGRRRPYPTMPPHKLWAKERVERMTAARIRLEDDKRVRGLFSVTQREAIDFVFGICGQRSTHNLARAMHDWNEQYDMVWGPVTARTAKLVALKIRALLQVVLDGYDGEHEHFFGRAISRLDAAIALLRKRECASNKPFASTPGQ